MRRNLNSRGGRARRLSAAVILALAALLAIHAVRAQAPRTQPALESAAPTQTAPAPAETAPPAEDPDADRAAAAQTLLDGMTTREKVCQLLIVQPETMTDDGAYVTALTDALARQMAEYPVGGMLLTVYNMHDAAQLQALTADLQAQSSLPLILCVDEEGGDIARLMETVGTTRLDNMYAYRNRGARVARRNAATLGRDIARFGFNTDLAPVADVWSNPENEVIGPRAYSDDFAEAAKLVAAAVQGFHDSGTICCLKHFPGHGSTRADSHKEAAYVDKTLAELRREEFLPFVNGIEAGADMVMIGHLTVPALDSVPATFSRVIVTDLLRGQLGFDGVIITDGLEMQAAGTASDGEKALRALEAGCDLLLGLYDVPGTVSALEAALDDGTLPMEDLDAHVLRVLELKLQYAIITEPLIF